MELEVGDMVRIKSGAFAAFTGRVEEVGPDAATLKVAVTVFMRKTVVELASSDVEKLAFTPDDTRFSNN